MEQNLASNVEFYDQIWLNDWQDMERLNPTARHLQRMIIKLVSRCGPISSLADIGCGMGVNTKSLAEAFPNVEITGTDLSPNILKIAEAYVGASPRIDYASLDLGKAALDRQFDLVLCNQVLEHIEDDVTAIKHLDQMCKKYLLITVPGGRYNSTSELNGHFRHYSRRELVDKVMPFGYNILHLQEWGFPLHSIYKTMLGALPVESQKKVGLGKYGPMKRLLSDVLYYAFYANAIDRGENVILLAEKKEG